MIPIELHMTDFLAALSLLLLAAVTVSVLAMCSALAPRTMPGRPSQASESTTKEGLDS